MSDPVPRHQGLAGLKPAGTRLWVRLIFLSLHMILSLLLFAESLILPLTLQVAAVISFFSSAGYLPTHRAWNRAPAIASLFPAALFGYYVVESWGDRHLGFLAIAIMGLPAYLLTILGSLFLLITAGNTREAP